jgi:hypothetical protein
VGACACMCTLPCVYECECALVFHAHVYTGSFMCPCAHTMGMVICRKYHMLPEQWDGGESRWSRVGVGDISQGHRTMNSTCFVGPLRGRSANADSHEVRGGK